MITVRPYTSADLAPMCAIWNDIVRAGNAFPQRETLDTLAKAQDFFAAQTLTAVAVDDARPGAEAIRGLYILHPNNVGRCGHLCNASYAVAHNARGQHIGEQLLLHSLAAAKQHGFGIMQFNAVVHDNLGSIHLYKKHGFVELGRVQQGFQHISGENVDIALFYRPL